MKKKETRNRDVTVYTAKLNSAEDVYSLAPFYDDNFASGSEIRARALWVCSCGLCAHEPGGLRVRPRMFSKDGDWPGARYFESIEDGLAWLLEDE